MRQVSVPVVRTGGVHRVGCGSVHVRELPELFVVDDDVREGRRRVVVEVGRREVNAVELRDVELLQSS